MGTLISWLERNARKLEKPRILLPPCIPGRGGTWADFGCGEGIFTVVLYELLGPECEIHAVDKNVRSLRNLTKNFSAMHPGAILPAHHADFTQALDLPALDGFVIANALHFLRDSLKERVFARLVGLLKPGGRAIVIEYNSHRGNYAVPHPLDEAGFQQLADAVDLEQISITAKTPSSFMGEMYAGVGLVPIKRLKA